MVRLHDHKILTLLFCLPDCLSSGSTKRLCRIVLRKYDTMQLLRRTTHCHRLVLQFRVQHTLDRGIEIVHITVKNHSLHPVFLLSVRESTNNFSRTH